MIDETARCLGIESLVPFQRDVIESVLRNESCLVISPTGSGKSCLFQIPALLQGTGTTIVLSPIISLMDDQVRQLRQFGIQGVAALHSRVTGASAQKQILDDFQAGRHRILYVAPERIAHTRQSLLDYLPDVPIHYVVIDEAHCWLQWQQDFRPEYAKIPELIKRVRPKAVMALTATAGRFARDQLKQALGIPMSEFVAETVDRPNLLYVTKPNLGLASIRQWLSEHQHQPGILFCRSTDTTEVLARRFGGVAYHGRMDAKARLKSHEAFMSGKAWLMVATNAFGMGVNKPDIRWTLHVDVPLSLDEFVQEGGRAGRDGLSSKCGLLISLTDRLQRYFIQTQNPSFWLIKQVYADLEKRRAWDFWRKPTINGVAKKEQISSALAYLKYLGLIQSRIMSEDKFWYRIIRHPSPSDHGPAAVLAACEELGPRVSVLEANLKLPRKSILASLRFLANQRCIYYRAPERSVMYRLLAPFEVDEHKVDQKLNLMRNSYRIMLEFLKLQTNELRHKFIKDYFDCDHQIDEQGICKLCQFDLYPKGYELSREAMEEYQRSADFVAEHFV